MPRPRSTSTATSNPFASLLPENQVAEALAPHMLDMLLTTPNERQAIKNLRSLRKVLRENPSTRALFALAPVGKRGAPAGSRIAKDAERKDWYLALAVRAGLRPSIVLRELRKEQTLKKHHYASLGRRVKALDSVVSVWSDARVVALIDDLKLMDPATRLDFFKIVAPVFDLPA